MADLSDVIRAMKNLHQKGSLPYTLNQRCTCCAEVYPCQTIRILDEVVAV